jgi:hypothetical protein
VSFASEPGRDDGSLPPENIVIPDDARELDRDVLAYHRELRARRRRERLLRLFAPFTRRGLGGHAAILPLIATCVALSMLAGAMLSVVAISPASAPTVPAPPQATAVPATVPATVPADLTSLPAGTVELNGRSQPVRSLVSSAIALVPADCDCGGALRRLASQAVAAHVGLYFAASGSAIAGLKGLAARYGGGAAVAVYDRTNVLGAAYRPTGLTVLLVYHDATAQVRRDLPPDFQLSAALGGLRLTGSQALATPAAG